MKKKDSYDIAISFLKKDFARASALFEEISQFSNCFIYTQEQKRLANSDGLVEFKNVFEHEAKTVLVLYREGWGETSWTRVESEAIKSRYMSSGMNQILFLNLDNSSMPPWVPKSHIYMTSNLFNDIELLGVIKSKLADNGVIPKPKTIDSAHENLNKKILKEKQKRHFLQEGKNLPKVNQELTRLFRVTKEKITLLELEDNNFGIGIDEIAYPRYLRFQFNRIILEFSETKTFLYCAVNGITGEFQVSIIIEADVTDFDDHETIKHETYHCSIDSNSKLGWVSSKNHFFESQELTEEWIILFIEMITKKH